jgi:SAM-dependent methyltransferase
MSLKQWWLRLALHSVRYADRPGRFELLYLLADPWRMISEAEASRFAWTNRLIRTHFPRVGTLLEVGCGEGHQSVHLAGICDQLFGIDVSRRAIARSRARCPRGLFTAGSHDRFRFPYAPRPFDLVVGCEMIYYVKDVPAAIDCLSSLGRACLVTYHDVESPHLDRWFAAIAAGSDVHSHAGTAWKAVWWHNPAPPRPLLAL